MTILKSFFITVCLIFSASFLVAQEGIHFFKGSWDEALQQSEKEEKLIFVDAYTTWCGPCKRMAQNVFTDKEVGDYFNATFINVKMDMESEEGIAFGDSYPVTAYPTLLFIDNLGKIVLQVKGAKDVNGFIELGKKAMGMANFASRYEELYEQGDRSPQVVYKYVKALKKEGKPTLKIVNDYINEKGELSTDQDMLIILEGTSQADSRIFDLLIAHRGRIEQLSSTEAVQECIKAACEATFKKAMEFRLDMLLNEAITKMEKNYPEAAEAFMWASKKEYFALTRNAKAYGATIKGYVSANAKNDPHELHRLAQHMQEHFSGDKKLMKLAENYAAKAADGAGIFTYYLTYASILKENGKTDKAQEVAEIARKKAEGNKNAENQAIYFIESLD